MVRQGNMPTHMAGRTITRGLVLALGLSLLTLIAPWPRPVAAAEPAGYEYFHTYAEMEAVLDNVVAAHPNIARKVSIGRSVEGRHIWAIKLTRNVDEPTAGRPEVMINGLMHARERASSELAIYTLQVLANNYGLSGNLGSRVTRILNSTVVWVIPMMNPDGAEYDFAGGTFQRWRKNRQPLSNSSAVGIDLNRQFGYTWNCCGGSSGNPGSENYRGPSAFSTPEARAYRDFLSSRRVNGEQRISQVLSLHAAGRKVLFPYAYTARDLPPDMSGDDRRAFVALARGMASRNGYGAQQAGDWYVVDGDQDDHAYGVHGIFALTLEMAKGSAKRYYPSRSELNADLNRNRNAVLWFLEQADCPYRAANLGTKYCADSASSVAFAQTIYDPSAVQPQQTNCWCVVASTRATLEHISAAISVSQTDVNNYMTPRDKNDWTDPSFRDYMRCTAGSPSPSYAHDGRGMAWALWRFASDDGRYGFNDYAGTNQGRMNWSIVRSIRATGWPVGIIAAHGKHAILAVGYRTALDPFAEGGQPNQILGFRVWDPWYNAGFGNWSGWPAGGFAGNSYITLDDWNSVYFTDDRNEGPYYDGKYVAVMRSSVAEQPSDTPAQSYGEWVYDNGGMPPTPTPSPQSTPAPTPDATPTADPTATPAPTPTDDPPPEGTAFVFASAAALTATSAAPAGTVELAVREGIAAHDLLGDPELGNLPATFSIGNSVHVTSLAPGVASYELVEILVGGTVRAMALVRERDGGYVLGELRATLGDVHLPTQAQLQSRLAPNGLRGTATLTWAWLDGQPVPPFAPFLTGVDSQGRAAFVAADGAVERLATLSGGASDPR